MSNSPRLVRVVAAGHSYVLAAPPILTRMLGNVAKFPLERGVFAALAVAFCSVAALLLLTGLFGGSILSRAAWLSAFIILFNGYGTVINLLLPSQLAGLARSPVVAICYVAIAKFLALGVDHGIGAGDPIGR